MAGLPLSTEFTGSSITEGQFKTAMTNMRAYLNGLMGDVGTISSAMQTLGVPLSKYQAASGAFTMTAAYRGRLIDCTGTFTISGLAASTAGDGFVFGIKNSGSGAITFNPNSSELVDDATTIVMAPGESALIICTGTAWETVCRTVAPEEVEYPIPVENGGTGADNKDDAADNLAVVKHDHGHNVAGSLCFATLRPTTANQSLNVTPGTTVSGTWLHGAGIAPDGTIIEDAGALSGTWRCLGHAHATTNVATTVTDYSATLWQRIS